jgi:hypothetical protein
MPTRGVVIVGDPRFDEKQSIVLPPYLPIERLRRLLLYWDWICCPELLFITKSSSATIRSDSAVHRDWGLLKAEGILIETSFASGKPDSEVFTVKEAIDAHLYAAVISAKALNDGQNPDYSGVWSVGQFGHSFKWQFGEKPSKSVVQASLVACLPVPGPEVTTESIIEFKQKRRAELLRFRAALDAMVTKIAEASDVRDEYVRVKEQIELSLLDLHRVLDESRFQKILSTARILVDFKQSSGVNTIIAALAGAFGANVSGVPEIAGVLAGLGLNAYLSLSAKQVPDIGKFSDGLRDFLYLYEVESLKGN